MGTKINLGLEEIKNLTAMAVSKSRPELAIDILTQALEDAARTIVNLQSEVASLKEQLDSRR